MLGDRRVHAKSKTGYEVVRYDTAGKWYLEWPGYKNLLKRKKLTIHEAVEYAIEADRVFFGISGGKTFDAWYRKKTGK